MLDAARIDAAPGKYRLFGRAEILANHGNDAYIGKVTRGEGEVRRRAAQALLNLAMRRLDRIERH
jgi:hypothetical protein